MIDTSSHIESAKAQQFYADTKELSGLKLNKDNPESLRAAAKQFEALFINMVMKSMREANKSLKSDYFNSNDEDFYQEMYDSQMAAHLASSGKLGLSDAIVKQMQPESTALQSHGVNNIQGASIYATSQKHSIKANLSKPTESQGDKIEKPTDAQEFIRKIWPHMVRGADKLGVDPKVLAAQAVLETGWGEHITTNAKGQSSYNLFNIKADARWDGRTAETMTTEYRQGVAQKEQAQFRAYRNMADSVEDYVSFIKENPRYHQALQKVDNPKAYIEAIHDAGYATDPHYQQKIMRIYGGETMKEGLAWVKQQSWSLKI